MKTLLLTGFGPFAEHSENPTEPLVRELNDKLINGFKVTSHILPVEYDSSIIELDSLIEELNPDVIINLGLAADREEITPELIAVNYQHSKTQDNSGAVRQFSKINTKGKESFLSTLPLEKIINALNQTSIPTSLSSTAGTYVCNTVMYHCLKKTQQEKRNCRSGFIHIPENLTQEELIKALTACINVL